MKPDLVTLPRGRFTMGAGADDRFASALEGPRREVRIARAFAIGRYPVTFAEWDDYLADQPGAWSPPDALGGRGRLPVAGVSAVDVNDFLAWLGRETGLPYRLPSEAEWEYACRAGATTAFATGDAITIDQANFLYGEDGSRIGPGRPLPVGRYPPNRFGLHDMHGSIAEWTADAWHPGYQGLPDDGSPHLDPDEAHQVCRGGSWDHPARLLRCGYRDWARRDARLDHLGFRLALDLSRP